MRLRFAVLAAALATMIATLAPAGAHDTPFDPYREGDSSVIALNILPPGQGRHPNLAEYALYNADGSLPAHTDDQLQMYENLVAAAPNLTAADLTALFKDASFGVAPGDVGEITKPHRDVTIVRDKSFGVPHVYGATRDGTMFGAGYVTAQDRLFQMDTLRNVARGRLSEFLGASDSNLASDRAQRLVADYTEDELNAMGDRLALLDPELGTLAKRDLAAFAKGVNAFITEAIADPRLLPAEYPALQVLPQPWKPTDSIALSTLIGGQFSVGGGGQLGNAAFLDLLEQQYPSAAARAIFDDFKAANDIEAPTATETAFPYNVDNGPIDPASVARPDMAAQAAALTANATMPATIDGPFGPIRLFDPKAASNALLVDAAHSSTGNPLTVFGPQVGYYAPEILMEIDMHGPGVHARGAAFPGISLYVLLGRGAGYGWSATTAIGDHTDVRVVPLCDAAAQGPAGPTTVAGYERDGVCHPMYRRTDTWIAKPTAAGVPNPNPLDGDEIVVSMTTERVRLGAPAGPPHTTDGRAGLGDLPVGPDWAIVLGRGTVDGNPVAFVRQRSSYGIEVDATLSFVTIHDPDRIQSMSDLQHAFGDWFSFSFNWHLIDGDDMGFYTTGRYPVAAAGVDQDMPSWGDSAWDWDRYLSYAEHPNTTNEAKGWVANWNNKQAPGFRAADDWYSYGSVGRVDLLEEAIESALVAGGGTISPAALTQAMGIAATRDLRAVTSLEHMLTLIGSPSDPASADAVSRLSAWLADGAHRRDLNGDRSYEHAGAIALMDALWEPALQAVFGPALGDAYAAIPEDHDDEPGRGGSAYLEGLYGQIEKDLRTVRGLPVADAYSRQYCGGGVMADCRDALRAALATAVASVNLADPELGAKLWTKDAIGFSAIGVLGHRLMHWQNRPTFQQVLEFA